MGRNSVNSNNNIKDEHQDDNNLIASGEIELKTVDVIIQKISVYILQYFCCNETKLCILAHLYSL